ncbi:hypothetical protein RUM44_011570 [Polyplax serrata]|uniref:Uncharacterized protein n=1 Tax=Polyplax serrata TaxID=468196 RepID=A0ABR1AQD9_POLSC
MANFYDDIFEAFDETEETEPCSEPVVNKQGIKTEEILKLAENSDQTSVEKEEHNDSLKRAHSPEADTPSKHQKTETKDSLLNDINIDEFTVRIKIHSIETEGACTHEVALPPDQEYIPLVKSNKPPAKEYKFVLDPFQQEAILCVENNQSVLVSAHTSAGKTVVAEYSIAKSLRDKQRVIYTTPIKALSNQKFREFTEEFGEVGLITGDVTINHNASVLIMTTEILRNMLYRGSEVMREVGWVVFDEIHYMRDKERGVVWEETLILLPDKVHYVFLSATIPNARQFAEWVAHLHHQPCHVVYTDYRPTPLQHYIFPAGGDGIHLVLDEHGKFREDNFNTAMAVLQNAGEAAKGDAPGRRGKFANPRGSNAYKIVKMIMERNFAPVICFSFSKKDCESYALQMAKLDFNTVEEKKLVDEVFNNAMDVLNEEDRKLPQVENVLPLLRRGIGIHHGGLLPILKEAIEILFAEGLIKALFATETFAMGLNMPARTVLFTGCRKFDGKDYRFVTSGEYIQMSGRAGRRGLDDKGIVILMVDEQVSPSVGREIVKGIADPINSAFHLTYNMVLNLLRVEEINPEYMLERSFYQFQNQSAIPVIYENVKKAQEEYDKIVIPKESLVASYFKIREHLEQLGKQFQSYLTKPNYLLPFLQTGRLVRVKHEDQEFDWGMIVNYKRHDDRSGKSTPLKPSQPNILVDILLNLDDTSNGNNIKPCPPDQRGKCEVVPVLHTLITHISSIRLKCPRDLRSTDKKRNIIKTIQEVKKRFSSGVPLLDPIVDMKIKDPSFLDIVKNITSFEERMFSHPLHSQPDLVNLYDMYSKKEVLSYKLKELKSEFKKAKSLLQMNELKCRKRILRRMGYCTSSDVIEVKGKIACELSSGEELLLTELIFNGVFNELTIPQCVSLLSCFVCDEKSSEMPRLTEQLSGPLKRMQDLARRIARISNEAKLEVDEDAYVEGFKPFLMDVVYAWCNGATFAKICQMTDIYEGSIIRAMRRLEEILRQIVQAAKSIGDLTLVEKFNEAIKVIKRDIVFAASLYL